MSENMKMRNTLPKAVTGIWFDSLSFDELEAHWSALVASERCKELTAAHYVLYQVLRGKDWRKALTPITNETKIANGALVSCGEQRVMSKFASAVTYDVAANKLLEPFDGLVTIEALRKACSLITPVKNALNFREVSAYSADRVSALLNETKIAEVAHVG